MEATQAVRVLRLGPGDPVVLFDGRGGEYPALLQRIEKERAWAELGAWQDVECESPLAITLIQSLQAGDKIIIDNLMKLRPGAQVAPKAPTPPGEAPATATEKKS